VAAANATATTDLVDVAVGQANRSNAVFAVVVAAGDTYGTAAINSTTVDESTPPARRTQNGGAARRAVRQNRDAYQGRPGVVFQNLVRPTSFWFLFLFP